MSDFASEQIASSQASLHQLTDQSAEAAKRVIEDWARGMHNAIDTSEPEKVASELAGFHMVIGNMLTSMQLSPMGTRLEMWLVARELGHEQT